MTEPFRAPHRTLPANTSVVVIGGGIVGVTTAIFLAEAGIPVVLCEKGHVGCPLAVLEAAEGHIDSEGPHV